MALQSQKGGTGRNFRKTFRGYDVGEVDNYINALTENDNALYRDRAKLEHELAETKMRLADVSGEEEKAKQTLETARAAADKIVADAYERSDAILASIKRSCDKILRSFRDKTEAQKAALSSMQENILVFKNELFERYRLHIGLIERISPVFEYEEDLTPEQYVERVISTMNRDVSEEFGINLDGFDIGRLDDTPETDDKNNAEEATAEASKQEESVPQNTAEEKPHVRSGRRKSGSYGRKAAVMDLLDEYETPGAVAARRESGVQMSFDFDSESDSLSGND